MRTRIKLLVFCLLSSCLLIGCDTTKTVNDNGEPTPSTFITIEQTLNYRVVYHSKTKVMYTMSLGGGYNAGNFTLLVNPDGSPTVYEEELDG